MTATKIKASDRSKVCQQVVTVLKKEYGARLPSSNYDVLDTLLLSVCRENCTFPESEAALNRLKENFFDYNELRVSSITEIQDSFVDMKEPEWKAMRARAVLQFVFENGYSYDIENLKKKTMDAAEKHLKKIKSLTPFSVTYTLLFALGSHVVPVDANILQTCIWLGLLPPGTKDKAAGEQLKAAVRKSDVPLFFHLISSLANDPKYQKAISLADKPSDDKPLETLKGVAARLKDLLAGKIKIPRKPKATAKETSKAKATKKSSKSTKESSSKKAKTKAKPAPKKTVKKKKPVAKKTATAKKKTAPKKKPTRTKKSSKKVVSKKPATSKKPAKKSATAKKKVAKKSVKKKTKKKSRK